MALECVGISRGLWDAALQRHVNNPKHTHTHTQAQRNSWHVSGLFIIPQWGLGMKPAFPKYSNGIL